MRILDRLPEGTAAVGLGLAVNGLAAYAFLALASRDLGPENYTPVGLLWALTFLLGPGFFLPLEEEVTRVVASRADGRFGPVVRKATAIGAVMVGVFAVIAVVLWDRLRNDLFEGEGLLAIGLLLALAGLGLGHLARGVLAGIGQFGGYARYFIGDGLGRLILALLFVKTIDGAGAYGLAVGLAPFCGVITALVGRRNSPLVGLFSGPTEPLGALSRALGALLIASVSTSLIVNVSPLVVELLADPDQSDEPGRFLNALLIARIPLFFFQAVQASLLSKLSGLVGSGRLVEMRDALARLLVLVVVLGGASVAFCAVAGSWVVRTAFGVGFAVDARDMALLAASSALLMVVLSLSKALIACQAQSQVAVAWLTGLGVFPLVVALGQDLFFRVEVGLLATVSVVAVTMALMLVIRLRGPDRWLERFEVVEGAPQSSDGQTGCWA